MDANLKILQFRGRTAPFLEHPAGEANLSLLKMSRRVLGMEVRKLVQKARVKDAAVRSETLQIGRNKTPRPVRISVTPVKVQGAIEEQYVVVFEEAELLEAPAKSRSGKPGKAVAAPSVRRHETLLAVGH